MASFFKILIVLLLSVLLHNIVFAQSRPTAGVEWTTETEHDFGDALKIERTYSFDFKFVNKSGGFLLIQNVRTECGCTVPSWSEEIIAPNETSTIHVEFDASKKQQFRKKITVWFDHVKKPETLWVEGEVL